ncbi:MAG TPA: ComEC/Rec2 family competence protein, partial [Actinomycetes bacterium]|nr:ComEC/Rec2 family competence protein [Actinomycetes bacterium]
MSDAAVIVMALAVAAGAWAAQPVPLVVALVLVAAALAGRWPVVLVLGAALAASELAHRSWDGLSPPAPERVDGLVTLVNDPSEFAGAVRVDVRVGGRRVEAWARGRDARLLRDRLAGERVRLTGHLEALAGDDRQRLAPRHVSARMTVERVGEWRAGTLATRLANGIRRTLLGGAWSLPPPERSLFAGFVLGDDRGQPPEVTFDFRASGLSHLLVVSGQNVAFVLALAGPLLRRFGLRSRLVAGVALLLLFGTLTRWEPSVLRAVAMAGLALLAGALGRPVSTLRLVALAATGLLLVDPLLVHSIGFRLSVGACVGIALFGGRLTRRLPGPRPVAEALGVTLAAQAGVAPVLVPTFGGIPVVALAANLVALPAAGPLMAWGVAAGIPAGLIGGLAAAVVHVPTRLMVEWVALVARVSATLPAGEVRLAHAVVLAVAAAGAALALRRGWHAVTAGAVAACVVAGVILPTLAVLRPSAIDARTV